MQVRGDIVHGLGLGHWYFWGFKIQAFRDFGFKVTRDFLWFPKISGTPRGSSTTDYRTFGSILGYPRLGTLTYMGYIGVHTGI